MGQEGSRRLLAKLGGARENFRGMAVVLPHIRSILPLRADVISFFYFFFPIRPPTPFPFVSFLLFFSNTLSLNTLAKHS